MGCACSWVFTGQRWLHQGSPQRWTGCKQRCLLLLHAHTRPCANMVRLQAGNYGGAWYRQQREFAEFPGPVLVS
jgi:hypothetical protein